MTQLLLGPENGYGAWQLKDHAALPFDVCFGESVSRGIPYRTLQGSESARVRPPVVNFYQHFKQLTWKFEMVATLRR